MSLPKLALNLCPLTNQQCVLYGLVIIFMRPLLPTRLNSQRQSDVKRYTLHYKYCQE